MVLVTVMSEITKSCLSGIAETRDKLQLRGLDWIPTWCLVWWPTLCVVSGTDALACLLIHGHFLVLILCVISWYISIEVKFIIDFTYTIYEKKLFAKGT